MTVTDSDGDRHGDQHHCDAGGIVLVRVARATAGYYVTQTVAESRRAASQAHRAVTVGCPGCRRPGLARHSSGLNRDY